MRCPDAVRSRSPADASRSAGRRFSPKVRKRCVASSSVEPRGELDSAVNSSNTDEPVPWLWKTRDTGRGQRDHPMRPASPPT